MRHPGLAPLLALALTLGACDKLGLGGSSTSPTPPTGPLASGDKVVYSAVGASDVIGYGSSKTCQIGRAHV